MDGLSDVLKVARLSGGVFMRDFTRTAQVHFTLGLEAADGFDDPALGGLDVLQLKGPHETDFLVNAEFPGSRYRCCWRLPWECG